MAFNYYSGVVATALTAGVSSGDTDLSVDDGSTYPDPAAPGYGPYKILVGYETSREEACLVTAKPSANVLRVTRAQDSTPATAKNAGDVIVVGSTAADMREISLRLPLTGGTMTGNIVLAGPPTTGLHPATKTYVDTADALLLPKAGGTMTGALTLPGAPTVDLHAATKAYVDAAIAGFTYQDWTPTVSQGAATNISKTVEYSKYLLIGEHFVFSGKVEFLAAGASGSVVVSLPFNLAGVARPLGVAEFRDASGSQYPCIAHLASSSTIAFRRTDQSPTNWVGSDPAIVVASGDTLSWHIAGEKG